MEEGVVVQKESSKVGQEQVQELLFGDKISWQSIIYDLINTEQLNPWDVDLVNLTDKFLEKVKELEEANFFVSSKVLLAASLLLRIKSEILLNQDLPSLDDVLFGKKEEDKKYIQERIELDDDIPELVPRTPLPRARRVTLQELMSALGKAISTENRRIKKVVVAKQQEIETALSLPKKRINIRDQIKGIHAKVKKIFEAREDKIGFEEFVGSKKKDDRIGHFVPLLHLDNNHHVLLEQEKHASDIWIWTKDLHNRKHKALLELMEKESLESEEQNKNETGFENKIGDQI